ncbi:MAG: glutamate--tRNA ligase [Calditrichia bacterium]
MNSVRVRFAPSPTGYLHVGGLRTALYNYLFARKNNGVFVLRIEDTDRTRYVEGAVENLMNTLKLCGLEYDEGPDKPGEFGPYIQSERFDLYKKHARQLVDEGKAYPCFCTPEDLEQMRKEQQERGETPQYDRRCRNIDPSTARKRMETEPHVIRLKMPTEGETQFHDLIRGDISMPNEMSDDQVLIKTDGYPTYHLANVVDDHYMGITHVIRGEEWLPSVPKHITLYNMFGWELPQFAHLPLLLNPDRSKLSKRQGDVAVEDYLKKGYLPEALVNFVALLGWNPGNDQEIFTRKELIEQFSLERVNKSGAVFDINKLRWMNGMYLRNLDDQKFVEFTVPFLKDAGLDVDSEPKIEEIVLSFKQKIETAAELPEKAAIFFSDQIEIKEEDALEIIKSDPAKKVLAALKSKIESMDQIDLNSFQVVMKEVQKETGVKGKDLWMPVRVALTGVTHGPELPIIIDVFGKEKILNFLDTVLQEY